MVSIAEEVIAQLALSDDPPAGRPRVVAAMIASVDGRAAVAGRSVGLGHPADRELLRGLRAAADAVLVGAATVRAERYATLFDGDDRKPIGIVTRSGDVPWDVGLFSESGSPVVVYSAVAVTPPDEVAAPVRVAPAAELDEALADLREREGARVVLCEGGPRVLRALVARGLIDDLVLTIAPLLAAGDAPTPLSGPALDPPAQLALAGTWRADDHLFLHYRA
jgi:riboflavin biosynthesis pyrimidine reductase